MTNIFKSFILSILVLSAFSFAPNKKEKKEIKPNKSKITWTGKKVGGEHTGTIELHSGHIFVKNGELVGGELIINMRSIAVTDLSGKSKTDLEKHLKSDDFFGAEAFPVAILKITSAKKTGRDLYKVKANLTLKGITQSITFEMMAGKHYATANFQIDRSKYNVRYGSKSFFDDLGNKFIYDLFDVSATIRF